jgi:hypothetical protein
LRGLGCWLGLTVEVWLTDRTNACGHEVLPFCFIDGLREYFRLGETFGKSCVLMVVEAEWTYVAWAAAILVRNS